MFTMEHKSSLLRVLEAFAIEPMRIHYIKEIARKIGLAPTSVKLHIKYLLKTKVILKKKGEIFSGYIANRDNADFTFYKKILNLIKLKESGILNFIAESLFPEAIVLYGSYSKGDDVEGSDIDLLIITKVKKRIEAGKFEIILKRKIHIMAEKSLSNLSKELRTEIINGIVMHGYLKYG